MNSESQSGPSQRVLVTGGSGFIGTNLVDAYLSAGAAVLNVDVLPPRNRAHASVWRDVDVMNARQLRDAFAAFRPTVVFHLAARTDLDESGNLDSYAVNTAGVANVIDGISATDSVERSFFASTRLVFDIDYVPMHEFDYRPSTLYGQSKARGEELVRAAGSALGTWTILRPTGIWGPWFGVPYRDFFATIERGWYVHPAGRVVRKSFGFVGNTVHQLLWLASAQASEVDRKVLWIADYEPILVKDWADSIQRAMSARRIPSLPVSVLRAAALAGDAVRSLGVKHPPLTTFRLDNMLTDMLYRTDELEQIVGALPFTIEQGVQITVEWMRRQRR